MTELEELKRENADLRRRLLTAAGDDPQVGL